MNQDRGKQRSDALGQVRQCLGQRVAADWDWWRGAISPIDLVPYIGGAALKRRMGRDFSADRAGYIKLGGAANTPDHVYFYRRYANLLHWIRRGDGLHLRGAMPPRPGMILVLDWPRDRGRFNFAPDRLGVLLDVGSESMRAALPLQAPDGWVVGEITIVKGSPSDRSIIGFADLPR